MHSECVLKVMTQSFYKIFTEIQNKVNEIQFKLESVKLKQENSGINQFIQRSKNNNAQQMKLNVVQVLESSQKI